MTEFSFCTTSSTRFPTPIQMEFLWARQENLQNLKLYSHMVPNLQEFLELEPSRSALLRSFTKFKGVEMVTHLLVQIRGLRHLSIADCYPVKEVTRSRRELGIAISRHKETLLQLKLRESLSLEAGLDVEQWHSDFVLKIAGCRKLVDLSLPLALNLPSSYYRHWIARLPDLVTLTIYGEINDRANQYSDLALEFFSAATQLKYIKFGDILAARGPNYPHRYEQNFVRKDLGQGMLEAHLVL